VRDGGLPYEAVTAAVQSPACQVWVELLKLAPTFNLLRSLSTFGRHGVFQDSANVELAVRKLTAPEALRRARIFPFQAYAAWKAYSQAEGADPRLIAALSDALEASTDGMPLFRGRVALAPDVSGSMQGCTTSERSHTSAAEVAGVLTAGLLRKCPDVRVLPFEEQVIDLALNPRDSVLTNAQAIASVGGGGTSLCAPVERLLAERDAVNLFVGITDEEEWVGRGFLTAWREYRKTVAPNAQAVLVTVVPGPHAAVPESEPGVHFVHGWSDAVLRFVADVGGAVETPTLAEEEDE
jgi:60 kDa SS-A/Ro ribonucleoprotein